MLITFQDRLRISWRGGAKQFLPEALIPALAIPLIIALAAINGRTAIIMLVLTSVLMAYSLTIVKRSSSRTRFFTMWIIFSIIYMSVLFEFTMPLLELLPEENLILVVLSIIAIGLLIRTNQLAPFLNHIIQTSPIDELSVIIEATTNKDDDGNETQTTLLLESGQQADELDHEPNICEYCRKYMATRTEHCSVCGVCIVLRDHHSYFLNCCIGKTNHRYYLAGLVFALLTLLFGANLTLTAVCHPFLIVRLIGVPIMLPDDCSEVFHDYQLAVSFIVAGYALLIALYVFSNILCQLVLISRGITLLECQRGHSPNHKSIWENWKTYLLEDIFSMG